MKKGRSGGSYNQRLFSGGFRRKLHLARFEWFAQEYKRLGDSPKSIIELGCFDGKLIDFLPIKPRRYVGYDANWENGLDIAREKWKEMHNFTFVKAESPEEITIGDGEKFDVAVAMETLEHVPPGMVSGYLMEIGSHLDGYFYITVPNEKGIVFLLKWLVKGIVFRDAEHYSVDELINATLGRMQYVVRHEHKGFDYDALRREVEQYFDILKISSLPFAVLPRWLSFGIGIVAKSRVGCGEMKSRWQTDRVLNTTGGSTV